MKLMMSITSGGCFFAVVAMGYALDNPLPTTLMRATIAMLTGLLLARWWGLTVQRQLAMIFMNEIKAKEETGDSELDANEVSQTSEQTLEGEVTAE